MKKKTVTSRTPFDIIEDMKRRGMTKVVLAFSAGKDSIAAWCCLKDKGIEVIPVYKYQFPDLDLEQNIIKFYEKFFGAHVHQIPHKAFSQIFKEMLFQDPVGVRICEECNLWQSPSNDSTMSKWLKNNNYDHLPLVVGIKRADSMRRAITIKRYGEIHNKTVYLMANTGDNMIATILKHYKCPLPSYYKVCNESFDRLRLPTIEYIKTHFPQDYKTLQKWMPLIHLQEMRLKIGQ